MIGELNLSVEQNIEIEIKVKSFAFFVRIEKFDQKTYLILLQGKSRQPLSTTCLYYTAKPSEIIDRFVETTK